MAVLSSEAVILSALRYGDTSRIVRLATREFGVVSAIARGADRPRSRFGAALQTLSHGVAHLLPARQSDLHRLTAFDLQHIPIRLAGSMERYAAALALAEVTQRFSPADPHPEAFESLVDGLAGLERASDEQMESAALRSLWVLVSLLGFAPELDQCVLDGTRLATQGPLAFNVQSGGALCAACARTHPAATLPPEDRASLTILLDRTTELPALDARHAAAHRRLVARFIHAQLADGAELKAVEFWLRRPWERA